MHKSFTTQQQGKIVREPFGCSFCFNTSLVLCAGPLKRARCTRRRGPQLQKDARTETVAVQDQSQGLQEQCARPTRARRALVADRPLRSKPPRTRTCAQHAGSFRHSDRRLRPDHTFTLGFLSPHGEIASVYLSRTNPSYLPSRRLRAISGAVFNSRLEQPSWPQ